MDSQNGLGAKTAVIVAAVVVLAVIGFFVFAGGDESATQPDMQDTTMQSTDTTNEQPQTNSEQADQELTIDMTNYEFSVDSIEASPGETITINLTNSGGDHNFIIDELDVASQTISGGETTTITFTVPDDANGQSYAFYCGISNHRQLGMEGVLTISE